MVEQQEVKRSRGYMGPEDYKGPVKKCRHCGLDYPATEDYFYKSKHGKHGVDTICQGCKKAYEAVKGLNPGMMSPEEYVALRRTRKWYPYDGKTTFLQAMEEEQRTGELALGWRRCKKCLKVRPQLKEFYHLLPKDKYDPDAPRHFSGTCRVCTRRRKKWKRAQKRERAQLQAANTRIEAEESMTAQQAHEAAVEHQGGFKPDRSGPTLIW